MESGQKMEREKDNLNFEETELRLGLPGGRGGGGGGAHEGDHHHHHHHHVVKNNNSTNTNGKRGFEEDVDLKLNLSSKVTAKPLGAKAQVVGWPPVRSFRKNILAVQKSSGEVDHEDSSMNVNAAAAAISLVKVSMDGAPYLRKVDLKMYNTYQQLSHALANMFSSFTIGKCGSEGMKDLMNEGKLMDLLSGSDYVPTYEDKDGDWMLIGDVPWEMFVDSCKRVRIMKGTEAMGLAPRAMEKCKNRS